MESHRIPRTTWVYWVTLAVICGQLAYWIWGAIQFFLTLRPLLDFAGPTRVIQTVFQTIGILRFVHEYVFGLLNILIYSVLAYFLLLANRRVMTIFGLSAAVVAGQQVLGLILLYPNGSTRDWATTIGGNLGLALYLYLLLLAFEEMLYGWASGIKTDTESAPSAGAL